MALMGVTGSSRSELRQRREHRRGGITAMIMGMGTLRITEAELARDIHAVLAKVQEGAEILVEQDHHAVAVIRSEEHTSELQSLRHLVCRLLLEKKKNTIDLKSLPHPDRPLLHSPVASPNA